MDTFRNSARTGVYLLTSLLETIRFVETSEVAIDLSICNDITDFDFIVPTLEPVQAVLIEENRHEVVRLIVSRIHELADTPVDAQYRNDADFALAAYIWILSRIKPEIARLIGRQVANIPNVWWAARASERVFTQIFGAAEAWPSGIAAHDLADVYGQFKAGILIPNWQFFSSGSATPIERLDYEGQTTLNATATQAD